MCTDVIEGVGAEQVCWAKGTGSLPITVWIMSRCSAHWHTTTQERRPCEVVAKNLANSIRQAEAAWNGLHTAWAQLKTKAVWPNQNIAINITKHLSISFNIYQKCKRCQIMSKKAKHVKTVQNSQQLALPSAHASDRCTRRPLDHLVHTEAAFPETRGSLASMDLGCILSRMQNSQLLLVDSPGDTGWQTRSYHGCRSSPQTAAWCSASRTHAEFLQKAWVPLLWMWFWSVAEAGLGKYGLACRASHRGKVSSKQTLGKQNARTQQQTNENSINM